MDILSLLLSCSLYPQDDAVKSLINVLSNANPYYVTDKHGSVSGLYPQTQVEAETVVRQIQTRNGQPLIGLMAVNTAAAANYNAGPASLFDGCKNVEVGTAMLAAFEDACRTAGDKDARDCAIGRYAETVGITPSVLQEAVKANMSANVKPSDDELQNIPAPERADIFVDTMPEAGQTETETRSNAVFMPVHGEAQESDSGGESVANERNQESSAAQEPVQKNLQNDAKQSASPQAAARLRASADGEAAPRDTPRPGQPD